MTRSRGIHFFMYLVAFGALALTHLSFLKMAPAFHLDEAWAALFSHRIANERGFWPLQAMSTYTCAWSHYVTAAVFRIFGTNLLSFRATGILEVFLGLALISAGLEILEERLAAILFPLVVAFFPTLVMNHRWVIEQDTFFVLCAGAVFLGFALRMKRGPCWPAALLIALGTTIGIGSHVLFLGPALTVWIYLLLRGELGELRDRFVVAAVALLSLPFFVLILRTEPEPGRPLALITLDSVILVSSLWPAAVRRIQAVPERVRLRVLWLLTVCSVPLLVPFTVFGEGSWLELFFSGQLRAPYLVGTIIAPIALLLISLSREWRPVSLIRRGGFLCMIPISLLVIQGMVVKPGPRYFELPYLFLALFLALGLARIRLSRRFAVLGLWITLGSLQLGLGYFRPAIEQSQVARAYRFWIFHDASYDMLPKLVMAERLARAGCRYSDIQVPDDRIRQTLQFLSYGDWPPVRAGGCKLARPVVITAASWAGIRTPGWRNCCSP